MTRQVLAFRAFSTAPAKDPLELMRTTFNRRGMCDEDGFRKPEVHWTMALAFGADDPMMPPNLRTVGIQRISNSGVDFVVKHGSPSHNVFESGRPVALVVQTGRYVYGETTEQWRSEGQCATLPLSEIVHVVPEFTVSHMVAAKRLQSEVPGYNTMDSDRFIVESNAHMTEVVQQVRQEILDPSELETCIKAFRFSPDRIERLSGGPDHVMWERWEWTRKQQLQQGDADGAISWNEPKTLSAH